MIAVCDVDDRHTAEFNKKYGGKIQMFRDYRKLFDTVKPDIVTIGTPDHMHAPITMSAIQEAKHVFVQKPLTHDVHEARRLTEAAAEAQVATQMGIQANALIGYRAAVKLIRDGAIAKVKRVYAWSNKPSGKYRPPGPRAAHEPRLLFWSVSRRASSSPWWARSAKRFAP